MSKKAEQSVETKLREMYELQLIDSRLDEIEILKGELPIEVQDLEDELEGLDRRIERLQEAIAEVEKGISNHQANIKESEILIMRYNKQLDEVKNNREYDALSKEIELQKLEIQLSEKKIGEAEQQKQNKQETLEGAVERKETKTKDLEAKK